MSDPNTAPDAQLDPTTAPAEATEATTNPSTATQPRTQPAWLLPAVYGGAGLIVGLGLGLGSALIIPSIATAVSDRAAADERASATEKASQLLKSAKAACDADVEVEGDGSSMFIDGSGKDLFSGSASFSDIDCILDALGTPESVKNKMYGTRALDGRLDGSWGQYEASWTYHPDDGLDIIIEVVK